VLKRSESLFMVVFLLVAALGCDKQDVTNPATALREVGNYDLDVTEPSGLCFNANGTELYTVSDATNQVFRLSLNGTVLATLDYTGMDLEGVAFDTSDNTLLVAEERSREIVRITLSGHEVSRRLLVLQGSGGNSGLEGIAVRTSDQVIFVVNEKDPARIYELQPNYVVANDYAPDAGVDFSGLDFDAASGLFWVVSDQAEELFTWDPESGVHEVFQLPVNKPEGVAIGPDGRIYVVSDADDRLYVFEVPR
jgi:uncharacterized protein YjiK